MWNYIFNTQPSDGEIVWVRMLWTYVPIQAQWSAADSTFTVGTLTPVPWYLISKWRPL